MPKLATYSQIEKEFGLRKSTMTKLYMQGRFIPSIKIGNRNYFSVEDLEKWLASRTMVVTA